MSTDAKKRILVVDDDPDIIEQITFVLESRDVEVRTAGSREDGERVLAEYQPDLAILDLMMETMDAGFVLAHHVKTRYASAKVILLTAVTAETGMDFKAPGGTPRSWIKADAILDKPVRPEQLLAEVDRLLAD